MIQMYIEELQVMFQGEIKDYVKLQELIKEVFGDDVSIGEIMAYYEPFTEEEEKELETRNLGLVY